MEASSGGSISPSNVIEFLTVCGKLKRTVRTGWKLCGIKDCESVADHSWRMGLLAMMLPEGLDRSAPFFIMPVLLLHHSTIVLSVLHSTIVLSDYALKGSAVVFLV